MTASMSRWVVSLTVAGVWKVWGRVPSLKFPGNIQDFLFPLPTQPNASGGGVWGRQGLAQLALPILSNVAWGSPYHTNCPGPIYSTK